MKKFFSSVSIALLAAGCSSKGTQPEMFYEAAEACNQVCEANPSVSEVSSSAGGGLPLLFLGKMETSCVCER